MSLLNSVNRTAAGASRTFAIREAARCSPCSSRSERTGLALDLEGSSDSNYQITKLPNYPIQHSV